ncbi:MAG: hypothetical protein JRF30_08275 [Deltaproteobacteria bacterium]|nr:hypothetical protein [Deltaproteobacteria bacterium]
MPNMLAFDLPGVPGEGRRVPAHKLNAVSGVGRRVRALKLPGVPGDGRRVAGGWQAGGRRGILVRFAVWQCVRLLTLCNTNELPPIPLY